MTTIKSAGDLGNSIRAARIHRGLSQEQLAQQAGVSRKHIGELEAGKDGAQLGTALRVASVVDLTWARPDPSPQWILEDAAAAIAAEIRRGEIDFALRLALDAIQKLRAIEPTQLKKARSTGNARWDALLAAGARIALRGAKAKPRWGSRLPEPWFPASEIRGLTEDYKELTVRRTPKEFADFNIYLSDRSLT